MKKTTLEFRVSYRSAYQSSRIPSMPTLRVELMRNRDDDEEKDFIVEKRVVHSSRVKVVAGYSQHAFKLKKCNPTEVKQVKERVSMGKALGITKKLGTPEVHGSLLTSFKALTPQSPSESDSFSITSSSSSCKSESDSIKKPSPPPSSLAKPSTGSLHMNLGSYFGAMWDANHIPPCDLSKAIHEKLQEERTLQNGFLEFRFSEGKMQESRPLKAEEGKATNYTYAKDPKGGCALKHDSLNPATSRMATQTSHSASACSHETSSETSDPSGDTCNFPSLGHDPKQTPSIKELMAESRDSPHKKGGVLSVEEPKQCQMEAGEHACEGEKATCISHVTKEGESLRPFEADVGVDRVHTRSREINSDHIQIEKRLTYPRTLSCQLSNAKHEEGFSFQVSPCEGICMQKAMSCRNISVDQSIYPEVVSVQGKQPAKIHLEKYVYSAPLMPGNYAPSTKSHEERASTTQYLPGHGSSMNAHEVPRKLTTSDASAMTPPSVQEMKCKANFDELTPLSPLSLSEASSNLDMYADECGRDYFDMAWFAASHSQPPLTHPFKAHWDWRSKSIGARASLKSAVRNLEAAFGGSRSVSLPKTRSQTSQRERKSESSKFIDRVFVSPVKNRHKRSDNLKQAVQRFSYSGGQGPEDWPQNCTLKRREAQSIGNGRESANSNYHHFVQASLPPLNKHHQRSDIPDLKVSTIPFLRASRSVHCLAPLKELSGRTSPLISTPPSLALRWPTLPLVSMLQGYLQCFERDGKTCYTLSVKDSDEVLLAKACTFGHNSSKEGCKSMYTFQSGRSKSRGKGANGWKSWLKKDSKFTTDLAGKMQVSSELSFEMSPTGKRMQFLVSEFVLYDESNDDTTRSQSLRFLSSTDGCRSTCTPAESPLSARSAYEFAQSAALARKQVPNIPRSPSSARMSSKWGASSNNQQQAQPYSPLKRRSPAHYPSYSIDVWSDSDVAEPEVRPEGLYSISHSELAAIVIKMPSDEDEGDDHQFSNSACRRSLKFCDDQSNSPQGDHQDRSKTSDAATLCGSKQGALPPNHPTCTPASGYVTMMLPKEHHGLPKDGLHGSTTLINRWKCGGKCDCGGWDLGCGMKVFSTQRCETFAATSDNGNSIQSISHKQPLVLYSQGKTQNVLLSLCLVQEGYFILKFQNELSPLKAFATSVAILHSRESSASKGRWMPIVKSSRQCQSDPETVGRPAFLEVCNDIPTWCPSNSRAPSPYGRA